MNDEKNYSNEIIDNIYQVKPENGRDIESLLNLSEELSTVLNPDHSNFLNVSSTEEKGNLQMENTTGFFVLPFEQNDYSLMDIKRFVKFIKRTEALIRTSSEYTTYISHLKQHGLDHCMILGNLDDEKCSIEMHHGPILNLFDYCSIVANQQITDTGGTTTFRVAKQVIEEHLNHNVQIIMLATSIHQLIEDKNIFINIKQSFGKLETFLEKYKDYITDQQKYVITEYLRLCETKETDIEAILEAREEVANWNILE